MLEDILKRKFTGEVLFDNFSRGRYSTDASFYQMMPVGVALPRSTEDIQIAMAAATQAGVSITGRGGGTSQCGQTVNSGLILDNSRHFNKILEIDAENHRCLVQPGVVLDELNRSLKPYGLWFPVDVSTASRATIGGMAANNSCGGRSLRYGTMRDNVISIEAVLHDGSLTNFSSISNNTNFSNPLSAAITDDMLKLGASNKKLIDERFPKLMRRVGGYNIDSLMPGGEDPINMAHLLVGSEGTLAYFTKIELKLWPLVGKRVLGACHFPSFFQAMDAAQHLVKLKPIGVELIDDTMINLSRQIPLFQPAIEKFVHGNPAAILLVEFDEKDAQANNEKLRNLEETMSDLGFEFSGKGKKWGGVIPITDQKLQGKIGEVRKSGLNIMMSMKEAGKPVSFVEDCAVQLEDLAAYTADLTEVFDRHKTKGTWYAHASVGCLHVRPVLNLKLEADTKKMRSIAEETMELVAKYKGSHSGEHGDGIVRSEFHERMFGTEVNDLFKQVKSTFDPELLFNPNKIVNAPKMDDRSLFRYSPSYKIKPLKTALDWSDYTGEGGGFQGAVEMCNNNGACRKLVGGTMCPSYRATRNEKDLTRGRANTLRMAISGQLGADALTSDEMKETLKLCVSCKGCKLECPTGIDMAKMKIEVLAARAKKHGLSLHDRLVAYLPDYAPFVSRIPWAANARNWLPGVAKLTQGITGFSSNRQLPHWSSNPFRDSEVTDDPNAEVVLFIDPFNRYFEPENIRAALRVLSAAGKPVAIARPKKGRPLNCGRTYLAVGLVERARAEAKQLTEALAPHVDAGRFIVGLEPSSLLTLRDEIPSLIPGERSAKIAKKTLMFEEYLALKAESGELTLKLKSPAPRILLHGHCHQKAMNVIPAIQKTLALLPNTEIEMVESSCCGMAGSFGYNADTEEISRKMGEMSLFPAVRAEASDTIVVADGTSCRHQIADGTGRQAIHVSMLLDMALI